MKARGAGLEVRSHAGGAEGNLEGGFHVNRGPVFHGRVKLPLGYGLGRELVEAVVDAAQDAHVADCTVSVDDGIEYYRARYVFAHELYRVAGIDLAGGGGLG